MRETLIPRPLALFAIDAEMRRTISSYPEPFRSKMSGRKKRPLGDLFGIRNFGVNLTEILPGGVSSILHRHSKQDEFVYIVSGKPTLVTDQEEIDLAPGMCAGFAAGGVAHHLINRSNESVIVLEIGDRTQGDSGTYPKDDLVANLGPDGWVYTHKDGTPY